MLALMRRRTTPSLMSDVEIARRVLAHIDAGTTDEGEGWREPVEHYLDPARFADELALLRSLAERVRAVGGGRRTRRHVDAPVFGVPLFAVRDRDGRRAGVPQRLPPSGVPLVDGAGCARLVCPYHGWTYRSTVRWPTSRTPRRSPTSTPRSGSRRGRRAARSTG